MNNYQEGHCYYFSARMYSILQEHKVKCKYCIIYGYTVDNDDVHTSQSLNHCYVKVGKFYYDSRGMNSIGCLLYTSPSPRDRQKSRMPSSA